MQSTRNKLIHLLADSKEDYISGQLLSEKLNISRSAIWKHMKELEKEGFKIEGKSRLGYRILDFPKGVSEHTLQWGRNTNWLGKKIIHKESTPSTQIIAHELARNDAKHGTVVIADEQTAGKGRMNRNWHSTKGKGIWLSMILRPTILPYQAPQLTLLTATVLADVIKKITGASVQIKWPNDILINSKKISGILTELQAEQDQIQYIVVGIGMNVNHSLDDLPEDINHKASSLMIETKQTWDIQILIQEILMEFEKAYTEYMTSGFHDIKNKWESYGFKLGKRITIRTMQRTWDGKFLGIAEDGALLVQDDQGETNKLYSAEIDWFND